MEEPFTNPAGEEAAVRYAVQRGYLTRAQVEQATEIAARGPTPQPLLPILRQLFLTAEQVEELAAVYKRASMRSTDAQWATTQLESGQPLPGMPGFSGRIGAYQVQRELARGGMGVVYVAKHVELGREVALKIMLDGMHEDRDLERFAVEAQSLSKLDHPGVVRVHEAGNWQSTPFLVMELVPGQSLQARIDRSGPLAPSEVASLGQTLAEAVQAAHARGILHRDLKPGNVLLGMDGRPRLTDFGLARDLKREQSRLTETGEIMGTPAFMPPEQTDGKSARIDERADVYSLGATLYAALAGRPPFRGGSAMNVIAGVLSDPPPPLTELRPEVDQDLATIIHHCLNKVPADRYPSAQALADDLHRQRLGQPIQARPLSAASRAVRWIQRNRVASAVALGGLLAVGGLGLVSALAFAGKDAARSPTPEVAQKPPKQDPQRWITKGVAHLEANHPKKALEAFAKASELDGSLAEPYGLSGDAHALLADHHAAHAAYTRAAELAEDTPWRSATWVLRRGKLAKRAGNPKIGLRDADAARVLLAGPTRGDGDLSAKERHAARVEVLELTLALQRLKDPKERSVEAELTTLDALIHLDDAPARRVERAQPLVRTGRFERARADVNLVLADAPTHPEALLVRALIHAAAGDYDPAIEDSDAALEQLPTSPRAHLTRGLIRLRLAHDPQAMFDFDAAIEHSGKESGLAAEALALRAWTRGRILENYQLSSQTLSDLEQALDRDNTCAMAYAVSAALTVSKPGKLSSSDESTSRAKLQLALKLDPHCALAHAARGELLHRTGLQGQAAQACDRSLELVPNEVYTLFIRAKTYVKLDRLAKSLEDCDRILRVWRAHFPTLRMRAEVLHQLGELERAEVAYSEFLTARRGTPAGVITSGPSERMLLVRRGRVRYERGNWAGALADMEASLELRRRPLPRALLYKGAALLKLGRLDEARRFLEDYLRGRHRRTLEEAVANARWADELLAEIDAQSSD